MYEIFLLTGFICSMTMNEVELNDWFIKDDGEDTCGMDDDDDFGRLDLTISEKDLLVDLIIVSGRDDIALDSKSTLGRLVVSSDILSLSKLN